MPSTFTKWFRKLPVTRLGRWQTQKTTDSMKRTIDFSNTDHCGTCEWTEKRHYFTGDKYFNGKVKEKKQKIVVTSSKKDDDDEDDDELNNFYYVPYCL